MAGARALAAVRWTATVLAVAPSVAVVLALAATGSLAAPASKPPLPPAPPQSAMTKDAKPPASEPKPPQPAAKIPEAKLQPATFAELPGWQKDDHLAAFKTFLKSCDCVIKAADKPVPKGASASKVPALELAAACRAAQGVISPTKASAKAFFEAQFVPHRITHKNPQGLLTGYYEPVMQGSRTADGKFQTPVYKRPPDLVNVVAETERAAKPDGLTHVRQTAAGVAPFPTRAEIEQGALAGKGLELLYLEDAVEVFFMHIQGSGRIHLTDGTTVRINYDGKNGYPYTSIGRYLIDQGLLEANKVSMQALGKWLRADKSRGQQVMWQNQSFIFFRELDDSEGPMGAMSVALTPGRSLAVDTAYHTLGTPLYVSAPDLGRATKDGSFNRLMVAQDVGSAIKGPERGDIYFGSGEKAGKLAGVTKHPGNFFVLLPTTLETAGKAFRFGESLQWETTERAEP